MKPFPLQTSRLVLDELRMDDAPLVQKFCSEAVFEHFMATPWPYELQHAEAFIGEVAPKAWAEDTEWVWAMRSEKNGSVMGVVGIRPPTGMIGYWLGAPHRGRGFMSEAGAAAIEAFFACSDRESVRWECVVGNEASLRVAQRLGFAFTGEAPGIVPSRTGEAVRSWTGELHRTDSREVKSGWPV